jgi:uncharacterized membrane protein
MTDQQSEGTAGVGMLLAAYVDENAADQALEEMGRAKKQGTFYYDDAAVIRQDPKGKVHIKETGDMSTGKGAGIGALIGGVVGLLGGPAGVALGAGAGAAIGGISSHTDGGFDQHSLQQLGDALLPGTSAIAATTSKKFVEEVRKQSTPDETLSTAEELAYGIRQNLAARQDVLLGLAITENGVAATQVVSSPSMVAVFGMVATEDGVVAGRAVATDTGVAYEVGATDGVDAVVEAGVVTDEGAVVVDAAAVVEETDDSADDSTDDKADAGDASASA